MAVLEVLKGSCPGQILELEGERVVLGRHPSCQIVLDNAAVSRHHARILESHGTYYVEDLRSRNGTSLNGNALQGRRELRETDEIDVCDFVFRFHLQLPTTQIPVEETPSSVFPEPVPEEDASSVGASLTPKEALKEPSDDSSNVLLDHSSILKTLNVESATNLRLNVQPEVKLRAVLEISKILGRSLQLENVLPKILSGLFKIFPQADEGFVLLKDPETEELVVKAEKTQDKNHRETFPYSMTIVNQAMETGEAILSADAADDSRFHKSESISNLQLRSVMCVPLINSKEQALGVIQITSRNLQQPFYQDDLDLLVSVAAPAGLAVENAGLHEEVLRQRDLERDLEFATQVQLGFLPNEKPQVAGYEFYDYYEAAFRVGGDYFDYIPLPNNKIGICVGDVAGKGVPAALLMARLYSSARYQLLVQPTAAKALAGLNAEISSSGLGHRFITFVMVVLDPQKHTITIVNAGHMAPLLRKEKGKVEPVAQQISGLPLGIDTKQTFRETKFELAPRDTVVLYSDGVTEAMNARKELYGKHRLSNLMAKGPARVETLVKNIVADVEKFCENRPHRDDICVVAFRRSR